jgi:hypothetical protein
MQADYLEESGMTFAKFVKAIQAFVPMKNHNRPNIQITRLISAENQRRTS